jgi:Fe-S cluster assembly ATP-binding protein
MLKIKDLSIQIENKKIIKSLNLEIKSGEIHAIMGPNGSGKSSLAFTLAGHPSYKITSGNILIDDTEINELAPDERSKLGLFLAFQYPQAITGVSVFNFLRTIYNNHHKKKISIIEFKSFLIEHLESLELSESFLDRYLNEGFSGGEKKKLEILQAMVIEPKFVILDETDSGLDIDALKIVSKSVLTLQKKTKVGILVITHYQRLLNYLKPDFVHILKKGEIVKSGDYKLAKELEKYGYEKY